MNQEELTTSESIDSPSQVTAGGLLRSYREHNGLSIDSLASALHMPAAKLEALEEDRLDALPDVAFARALALAVCRYLKSDAATVLALLPEQDVSRLAPKNERGIDSPLRSSYSAQAGLKFLHVSWTPLRLGAIVISLLAAGVAFWPESPTAVHGSTPSVPTTVNDEPLAVPAQGAQSAASGEVAPMSLAAPAGLVVTSVQPNIQTPPVAAASMNASGAHDAR